MNDILDLSHRVRAAAENSEMVRAIQSINDDGGIEFALGSTKLRSLSQSEITQLESQGNTAQDWSRVRVADAFNPVSVSHCTFRGDVVLGQFSQALDVSDGVELPSGVYNSVLVDCVVGNDALVRDVHLLAGYVVGPQAIVFNCGSVICSGWTSFGNGMQLPVGLETGGREVAVFAEINVEIAALVAKSRSQKNLLDDYEQAVSDYAQQVTSRRGVLGPQATLRDTSQIRNTFVGPHAVVNGATLVSDSTLLSSPEEPVQVTSGAYVKQSIIQWGSDVATLAIVDRSVLTEHSHVERHGKVTDSIIGPNSGVAEGEATACLLGPFVGFHHQALLIAALWPEGKGNVGYGANVGSNHTSKAPDQEIWPGEGAFLGLGVNIKFPSNFSRAPYSIVASGVNALPQKVTFPFSLINSPSAHLDGVSPSYNEIIPAWLLTDNMYTLRRNEGKYKARNKARRTTFTFDVFRQDIVELMRDACRRLESVGQVKPFYTDQDIDGLGKNFLLESNRPAAIEAYRFHIKYYALVGLKAVVEQWMEQSKANDVKTLLTSSSDDPSWEHQRRILVDQLATTDVVDALGELPAMLEEVAQNVEQSKAKDDRRGVRIIDDYAEAHPAAAEDKFVRQTWEETRQSIRAVEQLIAQLQAS